MNCEEIRSELVAYRDGELLAADRARVAAHLGTCAACTREEAELARVTLLFGGVERVLPSPDFAATFWRRLAQEEQQSRPEGRWTRRWREWRDALTSWQMVPALAGAASILVFFGYVVTRQPPTPPAPSAATAQKAEPANTRVVLAPTPRPGEAPPQLAEQLPLFLNYGAITDLEKFIRFEEIAAVEPTAEADPVIAGAEVPPPVLENPGFFAHYSILQKMDGLQNLDAVLGASVDDNEQTQG